MFDEVNHPDLQLQRFYIGRKLVIPPCKLATLE